MVRKMIGIQETDTDADNFRLDLSSKRRTQQYQNNWYSTYAPTITTSGVWWLSGKCALRPEGCRFESHSSCHV